jgi:hypothetical protein
VNKELLVRDWLLFKFTKSLSMLAILVVSVITLQYNNLLVMESLILMIVYFIAKNSVSRIQDTANLIGFNIIEYINQQDDR